MRQLLPATPIDKLPEFPCVLVSKLCPACEGRGTIEDASGAMLLMPCHLCGGQRFVVEHVSLAKLHLMMHGHDKG